MTPNYRSPLAQFQPVIAGLDPAIRSTAARPPPAAKAQIERAQQLAIYSMMRESEH
jgi:hypothetical protein